MISLPSPPLPDDAERSARDQSAGTTLTACARGAVVAEYVVLLVAVAIGCSAATIGLGIPLINLFMFQQGILLLPIP